MKMPKVGENDVRLVHAKTESRLRAAGIKILNTHKTLVSPECIYTTDKEVPAEVVKRIESFASRHGVVVILKHSEA
jgi:hypothetical protein